MNEDRSFRDWILLPILLVFTAVLAALTIWSAMIHSTNLTIFTDLAGVGTLLGGIAPSSRSGSTPCSGRDTACARPGEV
jgi:hypothetical protein